jgi:hypothetical protein
MTTTTCTTCGRKVDEPYRRRISGAIVEGCVAADHDGQLEPGSEDAAWHEERSALLADARARREHDAGDDRTFGSGRYGAAPIVRGWQHGILASDAARAVLPTGGTDRERQAWANGYDEALQDRRDAEIEQAARAERDLESRVS